MEHQTHSTIAAPATHRSLFVFALIYGGMTVLAGVLAFKQVALWPTELSVEAGIFAFLFLVVLSSAVSQIHGEATARRMVLWGFLPLAISTLLILFVLHVLPPSTEMAAQRPDDLAAFERVHNQLWRVYLAGPAAYLVSLLLNIWIFEKLRGKGGDGSLSLMARGAIASALSQAIDSVIFVSLAFYGEFPITNLVIGQALAKVVLSIVLVPFLIQFAVSWGRSLDKTPA